MFAGTTLVTTNQGAEEERRAANPEVAPTPDGGCLCYVLRSGFSSAQGGLMQVRRGRGVLSTSARLT
jgi:cation-transporting ATPase 13A1